MADRLLALGTNGILYEPSLAEILDIIGPTGTPSSTNVLHGDGSWSPGRAKSDLFPPAMLGDVVSAATSVRTTITAVASATPHTEGSWVEVDPSLSADANGVVVYVTTNVAVNGVNTSTLLEFGVDPTGGTTYAVGPKIGVGYRAANAQVVVPGFIAAGSRVAVRVRSAVVSQSIAAVYNFIPVKSGLALSAPTTYQADAATSRGLTITAPGSLNTKGAYLDVSGVTSVAHSALCITPQCAGNVSVSATGVVLDVAFDPTGGTTYSSMAVSDIYLLGSSTDAWQVFSPLTYGVDIPAGSRIAARYARANTSNVIDLVLVAA